MYIPIFIVMMVRDKDLPKFKRLVMPVIACLCCAFMVYCAFSAYKIQAVYYLIVFAVIMIIGMFFYRKPKTEVES
jgi:APA family basic amino acid/polyamine antiporter